MISRIECFALILLAAFLPAWRDEASPPPLSEVASDGAGMDAEAVVHAEQE